MSGSHDQDYVEAKTAQNFFRDAVDYCLKGKLPELKKLINDYLVKNNTITSEDVLIDFKSEGKTLLHVAASGGHDVVIDYLLSLIPNPDSKEDLINLPDDRGFTPLINATVSESDQIMTTLLQHGADVDAVNEDGAAAVHFAAGDGTLSRLDILTNAGADIKVMSQSGTALHWAAGKGRVKALKYLVERGVEVDRLSKQGLSAVLMAAVCMCDEGVAYLVNKGADTSLTVAGNTTVLHISSENGLLAAVRSIVDSEIGRRSCLVPTSEGNLPIHLAAMAGHTGVIEVLIPHSYQQSSSDSISSNVGDNSSSSSSTSTINPPLPPPSIDEILAEGVQRMADWEAKASARKTQKNSLTAPSDQSNSNSSSDSDITGVGTEGGGGAGVEATTPAVSKEAEEESDVWKRKGNEAFVVKQYKKAAELYTRAILLQGDSGPLWSNRCACYLTMGAEYAHKALADAEVCRRLSPLWSKACFRLGKARLALNQFEDAALAAFEGCKLDETNEDMKALLREAVAMGQEEHRRKLAATIA